MVELAHHSELIRLGGGLSYPGNPNLKLATRKYPSACSGNAYPHLESEIIILTVIMPNNLLGCLLAQASL